MTVRRRPITVLAAVGALLLSPGVATAAPAGPNHHHGGYQAPGPLIPIGGGYSALTEQQLIKTVERTVSGPTVDILVVPSSYGDAPEDRQSNLQQAQKRTDELKTNCEAAIDHRRFIGCTSELLVLLNRADALDPANSAAFNNRGVDLGFVLGGDQDLAMQILANSPAETVMTKAHERGVVFSGTSAGNAVESRSMITGYSADGQPWTGLQKNSVTIGWGDTLQTDNRGLAFGSQRMIFDQHFYQRGRFGRLLNITAQSVDRYGHGGKLGLGSDYATAPVVQNDRAISGVIGESSVTIFNYDTASRPRWEGADATLSVRNVLTQMVAPDTATSYDVVHRRLTVRGHQVATPRPAPLPAVRVPGRATVLLGGGGNDSATSTVLRSFIKSAKGSRVVVAAAGYADAAAAGKAAAGYRTALAGAGWRGTVDVLVQGRDRVDAASIRHAAGVVFVGGDQSLIAPAVADRRFADAVRTAVRTLPAVLTDGAMTAVMAQRYDAVANPTSDNYEDEGIRYFRTDAQRIRPGLGIVSEVSLEPWLGLNYRWGLVFGATAAHHWTVGLGVSEQTAIRVDGRCATVVGERSVVSLDGRRGSFGTAPNGAITSINAYVSTFAAGDQLR